MEMSDGNKSGFPQPWMIAIGAARPTCLGNCSIVMTCGTIRTPIEGTSDASHIVTPVTQAGLDSLMHTSTLNRLGCISPSLIEMPPAKSYAHVSIHDCCVYLDQR
jgi:hypothetical protein